MVSFEIYNEKTYLKILLEKLPATLRIQTQISNIISRAHKAFLGLGLLSMTPDQESTMNNLLNEFDAELSSLEHLASSSEIQVQSVIPVTNFRPAWDRLYIASVRQEIAAMHFYKSEIMLLADASTSIFNATAKVLEMIRDIDIEYGLHQTCTQFLLTATLGSLACMARTLKGPFAEYLDRAHGANLIEIGIRFARSCSLQKGDFADRCAGIAEKIWTSKKVFREPDGTINITLRVRNRLSSGPWHDAVRCWKEEFVNPDCAAYAPGIDAGTVWRKPSGLRIVVIADSGVETGAPSGMTAGMDTAPKAGSIPNNLAQSSFFPAPDSLLDSEMWDDLELGLGDNWDMPGPSLDWMA